MLPRLHAPVRLDQGKRVGTDHRPDAVRTLIARRGGDPALRAGVVPGWEPPSERKMAANGRQTVEPVRRHFALAVVDASLEPAYSAPPAAVGAVGSAPPPAPVSRAR